MNQSELPSNPNMALDALTTCLLQGVVKHTRAIQCHLLLARDGELFLRAQLGADGTLTPFQKPLADCEGLPQTLFNHCWRNACRAEKQHDTWPAHAGEPPLAWLVLPVSFQAGPVGLLHLTGDDPDSINIKAAEDYLESAVLRVSNSHETEALEQERDRLEALVKEGTGKLQAAQKELVRNERLATLGHLIATVSHELRNPLGTVRGSVFLIANKLLGKDLGVERALDRAERNIVRCDRIIEDLLAYTRTHDLELEPVRIDRWLEHTLEEYSFPHDLTVRLRLSSQMIMRIEPERLRRCLVNLINNASDAMKAGASEDEDGSKRLTILSKINKNKNRLEIAIADSGPGIPEEEIKSVLEPLYSTKSFGVGLGLPTVVQIMEQHNGGLDLKSIVGQGTIMTLWIPMDEHSTPE